MRKIFTTIFTVCAFMSAQAQSNLSPEVNAYLESYKTAAKTPKTRSAEAAKQTIVTLRLKPGAQPSDVASRIEAPPKHRTAIRLTCTMISDRPL